MVSLASPAGAMLPPATPLKRPLKRTSSQLDTDDEAASPTTSKKLRVTFDPNVDVRILDDGMDKSFDLVKEEVQQGIERHLAPQDRKDDTQYLKLLQLLGQDAFSSEAPSPKLLKKYLLAIDSKVNLLGQCGKLVTAILEISWLGREDEFVGLYSKLLCDLASAHGKYTIGIMERLASSFTKLPASRGRLPEETPVARSRMFDRLHFVIKTILRRVPSASNALMKALKTTFPNDMETTRSYLQYEKHLLRLADEVSELKAEILALIVQKLVAVDVQVQQDIEDFEEDAEERILQRPDSQEAVNEESDDSDIDSVSESEETITEEEQRMRELRLKVAKIDGTMELLFEYYTPLIESGNAAQANDAYHQLLSHFGTFILPNRCRHAQFLQFHFSQVSADHTTVFAQRCLEIATNNVGGSTLRLTACAYIASFVARGAHISSESVQHIFATLCQYLDEMRHKYEPYCRGPDRRSFSLYYAVAQAVLYIFCFRWRDLVIGTTTPELDTAGYSEEDAVAEGHDLAWLPEVKESLTRNIYSKLNPLKVCSPSIVGEFAKIANHLRLVYVFPLLETNKRLRLGQTFTYYGNGGGIDIGRRETAWDRKTGDAHHQLEAYFPFDPYHLPKSKRFVENDYNEWKLPRGMQNDDDDQSDSEDEEESDEESLVDEIEQYAAGSAVAV